MRYNEILNELKMNPGHLAKFAAKSGDEIVGGFEAECILADVRDAESGPDYSVDGRFGYRVDMSDMESFFELDSRTDAGMRKLEQSYDEWKESSVKNFIDEHVEDLATEMAEDHNHRHDEEDHMDPKEFEYEAREELKDRAENKLDLSLHQFLWEHGHITDWREVSDEFDIPWPHMLEAPDGSAWDEDIALDAAEQLKRYLSKPIKVNNEYHGERKAGSYHIEPDTSLTPEDGTDMGIEIVSPPMKLDEMIEDLENVMQFIDFNAYTNDSTGLHINLSIPNTEVDYTKLVLFMGDAHVLQTFGRQANTYAQSSLRDLNGLVQRGEASRAFDLLKQGLLDTAGKTLRDRNLGKYFSVNMQSGYVEFRSIGGDYIIMWNDIKNTILRFAQALKVATDPMAERKEYALKLYKLLSQGGKYDGYKDAVQVFSMYGSGVLSKDKMREYLRTRAQDRNTMKQTLLSPDQQQLKQ
jgi:hypothetical protein